MTFHKRKLLTIICEAVIEDALLEELTKFKIQGYTIVEARGVGRSGKRDAHWDASKNIRIEAICNQDTATQIAEHLQKNYYDHYAMVLYVTDVDVLRPEKF